MNYAILDAATNFVSLVRKATDEELDQVFQVVANRANDSEYASAAEPYSGICAVITAELKRRVVDQKHEAEDAEEDARIEAAQEAQDAAIDRAERSHNETGHRV